MSLILSLMRSALEQDTPNVVLSYCFKNFSIYQQLFKQIKTYNKHTAKYVLKLMYQVTNIKYEIHHTLPKTK